MILKITDNQALMKAVEVLKAGGVVMHPTETCYGLAVDVRNPQAIEKLYKLKGRDAAKPVSILVSDLGMAKKYGEFSKEALRLADQYWPGPLTILVPRVDGKSQAFVGIRCADHEFSLELVKAFGSAITTTSANLAGKEPLYEANVEVFGDLAKEIDLVIDGGRIPARRPSTIVKVVDDKVELVREGSVKVNCATLLV